VARSGRELYVGVTDGSWYEFLSSRPGIDEVNFWRPGGRGLLRAPQGAPLLFKRRSPQNAIAGLGFVEYVDRMSIADAWEFYGSKNGAASLDELVRTIGRILKKPVDRFHIIGCAILSQPVFFPESVWIAQPASWKPNIVQGEYFDMDSGEGALMWHEIKERLGSRMPPLATSEIAPFGGRGKPALYLPRQGQGTFRRFVLAAYGNRCAVTGEHSVPVIDAAHIADFAEHQRHEISNGIALRSDIHKLFDRGYVSIRPDHTFVVSKALAEEFNNGKVYYEMHNAKVTLPDNPALRPNAEYLERHYAKLRK